MRSHNCPYWRELSFMLLMAAMLVVGIAAADPLGLLAH